MSQTPSEKPPSRLSIDTGGLGLLQGSGESIASTLEKRLPFLHLRENSNSSSVIRPRVHQDPPKHPFNDPFHRDAFANRTPEDYGKLPNDGIIHYGNKIALKHVRSGRYLHAEKDLVHPGSVSIKKGLNQYYVYSQNWTPDEIHDYWLVLPLLGQSQLLGKPVPYGKEIRLQHYQTHCFLRAVEPLEDKEKFGNSNEVVAYPDALSDVNDVWEIQYFVFSKDYDSAQTHHISERADDKEWKVDDIISLRHKETQKVLSSQIELKGEAKIRRAQAMATVAADMGSIWRVSVPKPDYEDEIVTSPTSPTSE